MPMDKDEMWWMAYLAGLMGQDEGTSSHKAAHAACIADESLKKFEERYPGRMREVQQVPGLKGAST